MRLLPDQRRFEPAYALHAGDDTDVLLLLLQDRSLFDVKLEKRRQQVLPGRLRSAIADLVQRLAKRNSCAVLLRDGIVAVQHLREYR